MLYLNDYQRRNQPFWYYKVMLVAFLRVKSLVWPELFTILDTIPTANISTLKSETSHVGT